MLSFYLEDWQEQILQKSELKLKVLTVVRLKLPITQSMLNYFKQVRLEKEYQHQRKCTDQRKNARKREQAKKYKHKEINTGKVKIEDYQVTTT